MNATLLAPNLQTQQRQFEHDIRAVHAEGGGWFDLIIVQPDVIDAFNAGNACAAIVLHATDRLLRNLDQRSQADGLPCLLCDSNAMWSGRKPGAVAVLKPTGPETVRNAVGLAFCSECVAGRDVADLLDAATAKFRAELIPDLVVLPPASKTGHA